MEEKVWKYIVTTFLGGKATVPMEQFSFENHQLDSLSHVKLIFFLEREFKITLSPDEISKDRFYTVAKICELVKEKQAA